LGGNGGNAELGGLTRTRPQEPGHVQRAADEYDRWGLNVTEKHRIAAEKKAARMTRQGRRRMWRHCFWTKPRGHAWTYERTGYRTCAACGKEVFVD
jgi:hypothetical protein